MKRTTAAMLGVAVLCVLALAAARAASAQTMGLGAPMTVRFVGTFTAWAKDEAGGPESLTVTVGDEKLFFHITEVGSYQGSDPGMMLIQHIFPPVLEFVGPKHRLAPIEAAANGGEFAVEGWLYAGDNMFYVAAVKKLAG